MPSSLTPEQRVLRARMAGYASHKHHDPTERLKPANEARFQKLIDEVVQTAEERGEALSGAEIQRRAKAAEREHMTRLAFLSSKARARKAGRK